MTLSKEANKVSASAIGFDEDLSLSNARVVEQIPGCKNSLRMQRLSRINFNTHFAG